MPSEESVRRLLSLQERRDTLEEDLGEIRDELALLVVEILDTEGTSLAGIGTAIGVSKNTVREWVKRGRELAKKRAGRHSDAPDRPGRGS